MGDSNLQPKINTVNNEALGLGKAREMVKTMRELPKITPRPAPPDALAIALLERIPFLSRLLRSAKTTGSAFSQLATIQGSTTAGAVSTGFGIAGVAISAIDVIRIPLIVLAAWILGLPSPITLSRTGKWFYALITVGLALGGLLAPAAIASPLGIAAAAVVLGASVFILAKHFYDRHQIKKKIDQIDDKIKGVEKELEAIKVNALKLGELLNDPAQSGYYPEYIWQVKRLQQEWDLKQNELQKLHDEKLANTQLLESFGGIAVLDKTVAIALASTALIGLCLAIFFPPIGLSLVAASGIAGITYVAVRVAMVVAPIIIEKIKAKSAKSEEAMSSIEDEPKPEFHESMSREMLMLSGQTTDTAIQDLNAEIAHAQRLEQIENNLSSFVSKADLPKIAHFFGTMAQYTRFHQARETDISDFLKHFDNIVPALNLLNQALKENRLSKKDKTQLFDQLQRYEPLSSVLFDMGLTSLKDVPNEKAESKEAVIDKTPENDMEKSMQ